MYNILFILWFCTKHVDEFVRIDNKYCTESYGNYNTTGEAKEFCRKDVDCKYVFDDDCDGVDLKLCSISAEFDTSCPKGCEKPACTYIKGILGLPTFINYIYYNITLFFWQGPCPIIILFFLLRN